MHTKGGGEEAFAERHCGGFIDDTVGFYASAVAPLADPLTEQHRLLCVRWRSSRPWDHRTPKGFFHSTEGTHRRIALTRSRTQSASCGRESDYSHIFVAPNVRRDQ